MWFEDLPNSASFYEYSNIFLLILNAQVKDLKL